MAIPVLIIGKSGSGKSTSLRNCQNDNWNVIKVLNKPLPFKGKIKSVCTDDYQTVMKCLFASTAKSIVIDDAGYLLTNMFMNGHASKGKGNDIFAFYNDIGDRFWHLVQFITTSVQPHKIVYIMMHEDINEFGDIKPKTIGKMLDEKVCIEGMVTICLRCIVEGNRHLFVTQSANGAVSKSPMGMFEDLTIDNDLALVDEKIREYYDMDEIEARIKAEEEKKKNADA